MITRAITKKVFARITEEQITHIPLIFGSSVGHEVLANYPGKHKLHMITSQDTISSYLLKLDDETQLDGVMEFSLHCSSYILVIIQTGL